MEPGADRSSEKDLEKWWQGKGSSSHIFLRRQRSKTKEKKLRVKETTKVHTTTGVKQTIHY